MIQKGVLSARGERVDFDLLKIKQQIASAPKTTTVKAREDFIDQKFKRRVNRQTREIMSQASTLDNTVQPVEDNVVEDVVEDIVEDIAPEPEDQLIKPKQRKE